MTDDKFWSDRHARALAQAREARNLEPFKFATQHAISLKQLKELESEGCNSFYSERIKFDVGSRLLQKLGVTLEPLPERLPEPEFEPAPVAAIPAPAPAALAPVQAPTRGRARTLWWAAGALALVAAGILATLPWQQPADSLPPMASLPVPASTAAAPAASSSEQPEAPAPSEAAAPPPPPLAAASATPGPQRSDASSSLCRFTGQGATFTPAQPAKSGDYVYLLAQQESRLCLVDATGRETVLTLAAGQTANITGQPPFKLAAAQGAQVQVFYQGRRVAWPADASYVEMNQAARAPQP